MSEPRIAPGTRQEVGLLTAGFARVAGMAMGSEPPAIFLTLGRQKRLFRGWLLFAQRLMPGGSLPRRESELVILRVAHLRESAYEWAHHVRLGRRAGVTDGDLAKLQAGPVDPGWSPREAAILTAVDELHRDQDLSDATWAALGEHLDDPKRIELLLLVGHYEMLATTLHTLRLRPDEGRRQPAVMRWISDRAGFARSS